MKEESNLPPGCTPEDIERAAGAGDGNDGNDDDDADDIDERIDMADGISVQLSGIANIIYEMAWQVRGDDLKADRTRTVLRSIAASVLRDALAMEAITMVGLPR